jgi:hypothetical protein
MLVKSMMGMTMKIWKYSLVILALGMMLSQAKQIELADAMGERLGNVPYEAARFPIRNLSQEEMKTIAYLVEDGKVLSEVGLPSLEEIKSLEVTLTETLQAMSRAEAPVILDLLNDYKRQYLGIVVDETWLIVANFDRCSIFAQGQLEASFIPFLPEDGGTCFIETLYNPALKTFERFYVHGEA